MCKELYDVIDEISYADIDYIVRLRERIIHEKNFTEALPLERIANILDKLIEFKRQEKDMFEVDYARGLAYRGNNGYIINIESTKLYILDKNKKVYLDNTNCVLFEERKLCKKR